MFLHEPAGYGCPFCLLVGGEFDSYNAESDVFFRDCSTVARISPKWWPRNPGHALVMSVEHVENIYSATPDAIGAVFDTVRRVAVAIRETYGCEGTSIRQHNEPAGNQDVWHLHVHVFSRWADDDLYRSGPATFVSEVERAVYSTRLRHWFDREG